MLYVIIGRDGPESLAIRRRVRPAHLERVEALRDAGRLVVAGPMPAIDSPDPGPAGFAGSVIVAEFASLDEAREWADGDPYVTEGVFASIEVQPFLKVLP
ncbi:MAG TPA: YciI family protein [Steroidobacteraceae bacterium]|nr:YciI family protein [Steroidobacteraceae bacterium]